MSDQYQYTCQCGNKILVTVSDAGRNIPCDSCHAEIQLPGMRDIKRLPPQEESIPGSKTKPSWTYEKGIWFSYGIGAICLGLVVGVICFYIAHFDLPDDRPNVRGDWIATSERVPTVDYPVWGFTPAPVDGRRPYEYTIWDKKNKLWIFEDAKKKSQPREYFSKWGDSYLASIETSVENASMKDLWKFWFETEPNEPLKEWEEPMYVGYGRFARAYYTFSGLGFAVALIGLVMAVYSVTKRS